MIIYTGWSKSGFTIVIMHHTVDSCIINYCIIFDMNNYKSILASPCVREHMCVCAHIFYSSEIHFKIMKVRT